MCIGVLVSRTYIRVVRSLKYCQQRIPCAPTNSTCPLDDIYSTPTPNHNDLVTRATFVTNFVYVKYFWAAIWMLWCVLLMVCGVIQCQSVSHSIPIMPVCYLTGGRMYHQMIISSAIPRGQLRPCNSTIAVNLSRICKFAPQFVDSRHHKFLINQHARDCPSWCSAVR